LGFTVADVEAFYRDMSAKGVLFSMPRRPQQTRCNLCGIKDRHRDLT
jgi:hypothetical protein